jgi:hypothetical protein
VGRYGVGGGRGGVVVKRKRIIIMRGFGTVAEEEFCDKLLLGLGLASRLGWRGTNYYSGSGEVRCGTVLGD